MLTKSSVVLAVVLAVAFADVCKVDEERELKDGVYSCELAGKLNKRKTDSPCFGLAVGTVLEDGTVCPAQPFKRQTTDPCLDLAVGTKLEDGTVCPAQPFKRQTLHPCLSLAGGSVRPGTVLEDGTVCPDLRRPAFKRQTDSRCEGLADGTILDDETVCGSTRRKRQNEADLSTDTLPTDTTTKSPEHLDCIATVGNHYNQFGCQKTTTPRTPSKRAAAAAALNKEIDAMEAAANDAAAKEAAESETDGAQDTIEKREALVDEALTSDASAADIKQIVGDAQQAMTDTIADLVAAVDNTKVDSADQTPIVKRETPAVVTETEAAAIESEAKAAATEIEKIADAALKQVTEEVEAMTNRATREIEEMLEKVLEEIKEPVEENTAAPPKAFSDAN